MFFFCASICQGIIIIKDLRNLGRSVGYHKQSGLKNSHHNDDFLLQSKYRDKYSQSFKISHFIVRDLHDFNSQNQINQLNIYYSVFWEYLFINLKFILNRVFYKYTKSMSKWWRSFYCPPHKVIYHITVREVMKV